MDVDAELAEVQDALTKLRAEMDATAAKGGIPHEQAGVFARRMEVLRERFEAAQSAQNGSAS